MILHPDGTINVDLLEEIPAPQDWMEGIEAVTVTRKDRERFVDAGIVCREDSCAKEYCLKEELNFSIDD